MTRPLRIEFPGALYHITSRGDRRESIFADDEDRAALLCTAMGSGLQFEVPHLERGASISPCVAPALKPSCLACPLG